MENIRSHPVASPRLRITATLAVLCLAALAAVGCASQDRPPTVSATPTLAAPWWTISPQDALRAAQAALATYRGMWAAYNAAVKVPDPDSPELARYAAGDALRTLVSGLTSVRDRGLKGIGDIVVAPHVSELSPAKVPTRIAVEDCLDDAATHLVRVSVGPSYQDPPGGRHRTIAHAQRQVDGSWKVTSFGVQAVGTC